MHLFNMKTWILSIGAIIILTSILTLILPEGKLGKNIKGIFSLIVVLIIVQPLIELKNGEIDFNEIYTEKEILLQEDYIFYVNEQKITNYQNQCQFFLLDLGIKDAKTSIDYIVDEFGQVEIVLVNVDLENSVINSKDEHIDITKEISSGISKILNIEENKVKINGKLEKN